jgi:hypothetical protein
MSHLACGQTEEAGTGTAQESAASHSCSAGRLLVGAAYLDLAEEAAPEVATGLGEWWGLLVQERRLEPGACGPAYEGRKDVGDCGRHAEMLAVKRGPSRLPAPGRGLVGQDPVDVLRAEVEEQDFQEAGAQEGTTVMKRGV